MKSYKTLTSVMTMALLAISLTSIGSHYFLASSVIESNLLKDNIEALSSTESTQYKMMCTTSIKYTGGYSMPLYCKTCSFHYGYVATGSSSRCP